MRLSPGLALTLLVAMLTGLILFTLAGPKARRPPVESASIEDRVLDEDGPARSPGRACV